MALSLPLEQNGRGSANETLSELSDNVNSLIHTLKPFEQLAIAPTYQLLPRGRGRGGDLVEADRGIPRPREMMKLKMDGKHHLNKEKTQTKE